jgi:hypothetical protein
MLHKLVAEVGFEPTYTAYETVELPLLYPAIEIGEFKYKLAFLRYGSDEFLYSPSLKIG